jgi:RecA-family ATPase
VILVRYPDCGLKGDVKNFLEKPGNGLEQLLARCELAEIYPAPDETTKVRRLEFDDEITLDIRVNAIVKGILHRGELGAVYGPSTIGKTFCVLDLAYHVAHGIDWHGHRIRQRAPVLYVALEGERGFRHRMLALRERLGSAGKYLARHLLPAPLDRSERGTEGQASIIESAKVLAAAAGEPVALIVIDTLSRAIAGDDENSA